uniref:Uncharacterized protein n=1 Tax=Myotis myotis TaxID=51298 RepID=A0A7J7XXV8_MYOMY|nr:hypothetical protein mMyoMyo1_001878 [Myotis myotis]
MAAAGSCVARRVEELGDLAQAHIQQLSEAAGEDDHFLIRASAALEKLKLLCGEEKKCSNPSNLLELYTQHCDLLGDELLECLSWRRGALLYMYCHSLTKRREWLTRKSGLLKEEYSVTFTCWL